MSSKQQVENLAKNFLTETSRLINNLNLGAIVAAKDILMQCYHKEGKVFALGNGGSASTAQHFACDLSKYVIPTGRRPFDARSLTDNVSLYTAWANDAPREDVFVNQMRGLLGKDDVVIISSVHGGTGFSGDLVRAMRYATEVGAKSISLVGFDGGVLHKESTCSILVPVESTPQTEAIHLVIEHLLMYLIKADLALETPQPMSDILCVGHAEHDISLFLPEYPVENAKAEVYESMEGGGGLAANAAYLIAKWGASCAIAALVGDDAYGEQIVREFSTVGANVDLLERRAGHSTPLSVILVNSTNASRTIINRKAPDANLALTAEDFRQEEAHGVLLFDGHELDASLAALEAFPNALSILDAGSLRPGTAELARHVDYLVEAERFAKQFTGIADLQSESDQTECLKRLHEANGRQVVVTLGERGLIYWQDGACRSMPAFAANALDTSGAGDVFHGAFAWGILNEMPLREVLRHGSMAASISVESRGARQSIPLLEKVKQMLILQKDTLK